MAWLQIPELCKVRKWPAAGSVDTEIECFLEPKVADATTQVLARVQG
jgi:hypothetical protein